MTSVARNLSVDAGRFSSLDDTLTSVRSWPQISDGFNDADFRHAREEAHDTGLVERFQAFGAQRSRYRLVVVPHLDNAVDTFLCGVAQMRATFGNSLIVAQRTYADVDLAARLEVHRFIPRYKNCLRVEMINLGDGWDRTKLCEPETSVGRRSAHAQVLFAAAQDPDLVYQMRPVQGRPFVFLGGCMLKMVGEVRVPVLWYSTKHGKAWLSSTPRDLPSATLFHPTVVE